MSKIEIEIPCPKCESVITLSFDRADNETSCTCPECNEVFTVSSSQLKEALAEAENMINDEFNNIEDLLSNL